MTRWPVVIMSRQNLHTSAYMRQHATEPRGHQWGTSNPSMCSNQYRKWMGVGVITGLRVGSVKPGVRRDPTFGPAWQVTDWKRRRCRRCRRCWRAAFGRVCNQVRGFMNWRFLQGSTFPELPARCCCCRCAVAWAVAGDCRAGRIIDACCFGSRRRRKTLASACSTTIRVRIFSLLTPRAFENSII